MKIANFRSGDRAEAFGTVLMQSFCAVAPIPRQEDCGIVDAVASLLRRDGPLLFPEDTLALQFKSRTENVIEYLDSRFDLLLQQELALFIGQVDLTTAQMSLFSVGTALAHPNISSVKGLVIYLNPRQQEIVDSVLHTSLGDPVLKWSSGHLADVEFEKTAYSVLKGWLDIDRWNRRYRQMGMQNSIVWKTNEIPSITGTCAMWNHKDGISSKEILPAIQMIANMATFDPQLAAPVMQLFEWFRQHGVEPDPNGTLSLMALMSVGKRHLEFALEKHPAIEFVAQIIPVTLLPARLDFWVQSTSRTGSGGARRHVGSPDMIRTQGFDVEIDPDQQRVTKLEIDDGWLAEFNAAIVDVFENVYLLTAAPAK